MSLPAGRFLTVFCLVLIVLGSRWDDRSFAATPSERMMSRIRLLSDQSLAGRDSGSPGARAGADSIASWMRSAGLQTLPGRDGYLQEFVLNDREHAGLVGRNVLGRLPGRGSLADRFVIIGAHHDHLGVRPDGSGYYPGAEDNASGITVMLEIAARLHALDAPDRRACLFIAFSGEEIGLQGSRAFVESEQMPLGGVDVMLNLDSVGRLRDSRLYVGGLGSSPVLRDLVTGVNARHDLKLELSDSGWDASDHVSFNTAGVPVLFLFTGPHPQYHSSQDTWDLIPPDGLALVRDYAADLASVLLTSRHDFPYVADDTLPVEPRGVKKKRAWLGTIPDFVDKVEGVMLSGVMPDSPAQESGLQKGDVIVRVGDTTIAGLPDLTVALQAHAEGEMVEVEFTRDGVRRSIPVTLRKRPQ
jgi:Peptidase family M28/PDZ domain